MRFIKEIERHEKEEKKQYELKIHTKDNNKVQHKTNLHKIKSFFIYYSSDKFETKLTTMFGVYFCTRRFSKQMIPIFVTDSIIWKHTRIETLIKIVSGFVIVSLCVEPHRTAHSWQVTTDVIHASLIISLSREHFFNCDINLVEL